MSVPTPQSPLDGRCSAIDNGILYVLSSTSFQSLPLQLNGNWTTLQQGKAVKNPACIRVVPGGDQSKAALYVVGGSSDDSAYTGLQRYTFSSKSWETLSPPTTDLVGRVDHSVAYIPDANSIVSYAGSLPSGSQSPQSSQTFVISTLPPYIIRSFAPAAASLPPPGNKPILANFDTSSVMLVGQEPRAKEIWLFNAGNGWNKYSTELAQPINPQIQGVLINGADGSKVLTTYDATTSPNTVNQIVISGPGGTPVTPGQTVGGGQKSKRDLTLQNWPAYNNSVAPDTVRNGYTVTMDDAGRTVLTGGNANAPLNIFDNNKNSWVDNGDFFKGVSNKNQIPLTTSSNSATSSATTSSASSTSTGSSTTTSGTSTRNPSSTSSTSSRPTITRGPVVLEPAPNTFNKKTQRVLGISLGILVGIALIVILSLFCVRARRNRRKRQTGYIDEKDRMSFQDRGAPNGTRNDSAVRGPNHNFTQHNTSHNSFAMMTNKARGNGSPARRRDSSESTRHLVNKPQRAHITGPVELDRWGADKEVYAPNMTTSASGAPQIPASTVMGAREDNLLSSFVEGKKRSSGWSRYFAGGDPQVPAAYQTGQDNSAYTSTTDFTGSSRAPAMPSRIASSAVVPEHEYARTMDGQRLSAVSRAHPNFNDSAEDLARRGTSMDAARGQAARVHTPRENTPSRGNDESINSDDGSTAHSLRSYNTERTSYEEYAGGEGGATGWTPFGNNHKSATHGGQTGETASVRAPSSNYTMSYYGGDGSRVVSSAAPGTSRSNTGPGFWPSSKDGVLLRPTSRSGPGGHFGPHQPDGVLFPAPLPTTTLPPPMPTKKPGTRVGDFDDRNSTVTVFPKGVSSTYYADRDAARAQKAGEKEKSDMSWLNLGLK